MGKTTTAIKSALFFSLALFIVLTIASGYLYRENKTYQNENHRLIVVNDSILSENIELKNRLQREASVERKNSPADFKTKENQ